jgi:hypothetical protein
MQEAALRGNKTRHCKVAPAVGNLPQPTDAGKTRNQIGKVFGVQRQVQPPAGDARPAQAHPDRPLDVLEVVEGDRDTRPRLRWCCRECGYCGRLLVRPKMADVDIALTITGIVCWPLIIAGVLLKDDYEVCPDCGADGDKINGPHF